MYIIIHSWDWFIWSILERAFDDVEMALNVNIREPHKREIWRDLSGWVHGINKEIKMKYYRERLKKFSIDFWAILKNKGLTLLVIK